MADSGSAEVVQNSTGTSRFHTGRSEGDPEALDGSARTVEHTRADHLQLPLEILGDRLLLFKQFAQRARNRECAALSVLGLAWIEPDFAGAEVDLPPLDGQNLAVNPPAGKVGERRRRTDRFREMGQAARSSSRSKKPTRKLSSLRNGMCGFCSSFPA